MIAFSKDKRTGERKCNYHPCKIGKDDRSSVIRKEIVEKTGEKVYKTCETIDEQEFYKKGVKVFRKKEFLEQVFSRSG